MSSYMPSSNFIYDAARGRITMLDATKSLLQSLQLNSSGPRTRSCHKFLYAAVQAGATSMHGDPFLLPPPSCGLAALCATNLTGCAQRVSSSPGVSWLLLLGMERHPWCREVQREGLAAVQSLAVDRQEYRSAVERAGGAVRILSVCGELPDFNTPGTQAASHMNWTWTQPQDKFKEVWTGIPHHLRGRRDLG